MWCHYAVRLTGSINRESKPYQSWSNVLLALAASFKAYGKHSPEQIAAALMCKLECNQHVTKSKTPERTVERAINRSYDPPAKRIASALPWRERTDSGRPKPSMHNAGLAMNALGIECKQDTFHNKTLVGHKGGDVQHALTPVLGELSDPAVIRLRKITSDCFGFDLEDKAMRDAITSDALDHCYDPVADLLDEAEAAWHAADCPKLLDRWAVTHLNGDDTPLNCTFGKLHLIAAVKRVRHPGCKKDEIFVLESKEGWNKSSAIRVLAGDDNFSDQSILGQRGREVQEQLGGIWMHENADLAGLGKAQVGDVKAFASRQFDIARAAFGHFITKQPRHSIEWGSTNDDTYLQSQNGNRRFWVMTVLKEIDIDLLKRDRMLLLGEAAAAETAGVSIVLDRSLWPVAGEAQEERRVKDPWEDHVDALPKVIVHIAGGIEYVASADLLHVVMDIPKGQQTTPHAMRLANVMKRAGWERLAGGKIRINGLRQAGYFRQVALC